MYDAKVFLPYVVRPIARVLVFTILLIASFSKAQKFHAIVNGHSILSDSLFLKLVIAVEVFAAVSVLIATRSAVWWLVICLFSTFTVFAAYELLINGTCTCFGKSIPGWVSLPIDLLIVTGMVASRPFWRSAPDGRHEDRKFRFWFHVKWINRRDAVAFGTGAVVASVFLALMFRSPAELPEPGTKSEVRFLLAEDWIGKAWPISENFHRRLAQLRNGEWLILVLRNDCSHCRELARELNTAKHTWLNQDVKIATFVSGGDSWAAHLRDVSLNELSSVQVKWPGRDPPFVSSPAAFYLESGVIRDARDGQRCRPLVFKTLGVTTDRSSTR